MGHTRLGPIPKTLKWRDVVEQVVGGNLGSVGVASFVADMPEIAAKTLDAAQKGLERAVEDPGVRYTFYLLTQVALAARTAEWETALGKHGIRLSGEGSVFDLTVEVQAAIDRHVARSSAGATDLSEIAQQSAGEAILPASQGRERRVSSAAGPRTHGKPSVRFRPRKDSASSDNNSSERLSAGSSISI